MTHMAPPSLEDRRDAGAHSADALSDEARGAAEVSAWADRARRAPDVGRVADMLAMTWAEIDTVLQPVIGPGGVAALYKRSLFLAAAAHPWLVDACQTADAAMDTTSVKASLAAPRPAEAVAAGSLMLLQFHQLLASLIGPSLTVRLLHAVVAEAEIKGDGTAGTARKTGGPA